jgi:RNA polymerase sigma-70 factor, ECF subfamily
LSVEAYHCANSRLMREVFLMADNDPSGLAARERRGDFEARMNAAMERYASGDLAAFPELYAGMLPRLTRHLKEVVTASTSTEDLIQITFMKLHRARAKWRTGSRVEPYLFMIARNAAIECRRTYARARARVTDSGNLPEVAVNRTSVDPPLVQVLSRVLDSLPRDDREAFLAIVHLEESVSGTAFRTNSSKSAVKSRVYRARAALRRQLVELLDGSSLPRTRGCNSRIDED